MNSFQAQSGWFTKNRLCKSRTTIHDKLQFVGFRLIYLFDLLCVYKIQSCSFQRAVITSTLVMEQEGEIFERVWKEVGSNQGCSYSARTGHTVVEYNNCIYLFGGTDKSKRQRDLYKLDLQTEEWTQLHPGGHIPPRRSGACGTVHNGCFYLFGGYDGRDGRYFNDLFMYNFATNSWTEIFQRCRVYTEDNREVAHPIPSARTDHTMCYYNGFLYVFGGYDGKARFNDLLAFDLKRRVWTVCGEKSPFRPSKRFGKKHVSVKISLIAVQGTQQWSSKMVFGCLEDGTVERPLILYGTLTS